MTARLDGARSRGGFSTMRSTSMWPPSVARPAATPYRWTRVAGGEHGVSQAQRLLLAHADQPHRIADPPDLLEQLLLPLALELVLELVGAVEMVLDGGLSAPVDHDHLHGSGRERLLDDQLD